MQVKLWRQPRGTNFSAVLRIPIRGNCLLRCRAEHGARRGCGSRQFAETCLRCRANSSGCRFADRCDHAWELCTGRWRQEWITTGSRWAVQAQMSSVLKQIQRAGLMGYRPEKQIRSKTQAKDSESQGLESALQQIAEPVHSANGIEADSGLLSVTDLKVYFPIHKGLMRKVAGYVKAVDGVSLTIRQGRTLALVGESGCGKTTVGKGILQLIPAHGEAA